MSTENLHALAALIRRERDPLPALWRGEVRQLAAAHELDVPTLNDHIPDLLAEPADESEAHTEESMVGELKKNSVVHGLDRLRLGFDVEEIVAEYNALRGVIQNLISNAIDYTPDGKVIVGARACEGSAGVECRVSDNGAGIPADRLEKVFDKLESDPDRRSGEGLGLAIVKQFVEAHGGQVSVESEPARGSTFRFTIPPGAEEGKSSSGALGTRPERNYPHRRKAVTNERV